MWRIWYADGSTVDSDGCAPDQVPKTGVQYIRQHTPTGDQMDTTAGGNATPPAERAEALTGEDFFTWDDDRWTGRTREGLYQYLTAPGSKVVLFGYEIPWERYQAIVLIARDDPDFGPLGLSRRKRAGLE